MKTQLKAPTLRFRKQPVHEQNPVTDFEGEGQDLDVGEPTALSWTPVAAKSTSAAQMALIACLVCGPVALIAVYFLYGSGPTEPSVAPQVANTTSLDQIAASAFAEDLVVTWLTTPEGEEERIARYGPAYNSVTLPKTPWVVSGATTAGVEESTSRQTWTVVVAVSVSSTPGSPPVRRYFQVPVFSRDGALVARALPTPIAAPAVAEAGGLNYRYRAVAQDAVGAAAQDFLNGLLVLGEVERYVSPSAEISAVLPSPYLSVEVQDIRVDQELTEQDQEPETGRKLRLLVTADASLSRDQTITVQYALTMTAREGRWEVSAIDPIPALPEGEPGGPVPSAPAGSDDGASVEAPSDVAEDDGADPLGGEITEDELASEEPAPTSPADPPEATP